MKPLLARIGGGAGAPASSPSPSGPTAAAGTTTFGVADGQQAVRIVRRGRTKAVETPDIHFILSRFVRIVRQPASVGRETRVHYHFAQPAPVD